MKKQERIETLVNSKYYPLLLLFVSFVFVTLFSRSTSFLYITEGGDPSVFKQMGLALLRGKTLYIDYFDNKGCILYFIHALGIALGGNIILLLMQSVLLMFTLLLWDRMLALYRNGTARLCGLAIALMLLLCFYTDGDTTQEWCLPLASYPLLVLLRSIKNKKCISRKQMFTIGLCFGVISFIQINNATPFFGFLAYLWIRQLVEKNYRQFCSDLLCFLSGLILIAISCVLYFYLKAGWHGVYEMVYASFLSNFEYLGTALKNPVYYVVFYFVFLLSFLLLFVSSCKEKNVLWPFLISFALFVVSYGKLCSIHYLLAFMPLCIVGLVFIDFRQNRKAKIALVGLASVCLAFYISKPLVYVGNDLVWGNEKEVAIYNDFHSFIESIPEAERDSIYNYNLISWGTALMHHEGLMQCNRVLFTSLVFNLPTLYKEETSKPFNPPKWMMLSWEKRVREDDGVFILNNYDLAYTFTYDRLYLEKPRMGDVFEISIYRRKEANPAP